MAAPLRAVRSDLTTEPRRRPARLAVCVLAALVAAGAAARAQFTSAVNVVEVYASVTDAKGEPITDLSQKDFVIAEDSERQAITTFAAGEFPLSVALALDRSFSMAGPRLAAAKSAAQLFLGHLRPADESMLIGIGSTTEVLAPLSRDRGPQQTAVGRLDAFGTTGLYDAIVAAIAAVQPARGRRALVLLSDGSDRYSTVTADQALERARGSDVLIYPVSFGKTRPAVFAELASSTGGRSFHVDDARRLPETMRAIAMELRHQYLLGYTPSRPIKTGAGEWRSIDVRVERPGVRVRARDGYLAK